MSGSLTRPPQPRFLVLQVISKLQKPKDVEPELAELKQLITTYNGTVVKEIIQRRDHPDPATYIGSGKLQELKNWVEAEDVQIVLINAQVKSSQLFKVQRMLWSVNKQIAVWDRIDLILNIFDQHATTIESKLQIKLARVKHQGPRMYGLGATELSRQGGGIGTRGKGETNIEFERRQIKGDQQKLQQELKKVLKQKKRRLEKRGQLGIGPVALVGYTSAGKTTLFNALTGKEKAMHRGLFTTLDTVVGKMKSPDFEQPILISDTIGFISNLPPVLIESFKSTLLESLEAKLILHVVDASDLHRNQKIEVVQEILTTLKATQPTMMVFNKIDQLTAAELSQLQTTYQPAENELLPVYISAQTGQNQTILKDSISQFFIESNYKRFVRDLLLLK